ncbi:MAG: endonuclease [Gemmataceae bacterium]
MPATTSKQQLLNQVLGAIAPAGEPAVPLPVLEQFIFGICREDSTPEMALQAYENLRSQFFDWNEIRVSSIGEIEDALAGLSDTETRANRIIAFLQDVFETNYSFNLDSIQKKGLKDAAKNLKGLKAANDYVVAWVIQRTLGGHALPTDAATMRVVQRLGLIDATPSEPEAVRSSLEHLVPKAKGIHFTDAISILAEQVCWEETPRCARCPMKESCPSSQVHTVPPSEPAASNGRSKSRTRG